MALPQEEAAPAAPTVMALPQEEAARADPTAKALPQAEEPPAVPTAKALPQEAVLAEPARPLQPPAPRTSHKTLLQPPTELHTSHKMPP